MPGSERRGVEDKGQIGGSATQTWLEGVQRVAEPLVILRVALVAEI